MNRRTDAPRAGSLAYLVLGLALHGAFAGCDKPPALESREVPPLPHEDATEGAASPTLNPQPDKPRPTEAAMQDDDAKQAPEPTSQRPNDGEGVTLELAGSPLTLTRGDAEAIRAALIARLEESSLPLREQLIMRAKSPPITFEEGAVSIGTWGLAAAGPKLTLTERMGPGSAEAYQAEVTREDGQFRVSMVRPLFIHPRR